MQIALLQSVAKILDIDANLDTLEEAARRAKENGADLLLTPELFTCGYSPDLVRANVTAADLEEIDNGAASIARRHDISLVYSAPRITVEERWHISATLLDAAGDKLLAYDKVHLFGEEEQRTFSAGSHGPTAVTHGGLRISLLICYDVEFPESVRAASEQGAELVLVPTALGTGFAAVSHVLIPARALESQVVVAYANHCGTEGGLLMGGESVVAAADGSLLAHAGEGPTMLYASVEPAAISSARERVPYLRDRRPELYVRWNGLSGS
ncbi:nitrilase [Tersicoccus phoenicis]|uniref:Nitrilase n=1 Tax=Tersicoccus phoenicis TaxID=554083 RepID=A0A1R1LCD7_9MICC|nr:carbon-nitrogen hydrolase family protein [Tersicoccus phoenicis]OMH25166.1 nitrilase [Tersicoccus phoenicis]